MPLYLQKKHRLGIPSSNYDKNVDFVVKLIEGFPINMSQTDRDRCVFNLNQDELLKVSLNGNKLYSEFLFNYNLIQDISSFIIEIGKCLRVGDKQITQIINYYKKIDDVNKLFSELERAVNHNFDNDLKENFINELYDIKGKYNLLDEFNNDLKNKKGK